LPRSNLENASSQASHKKEARRRELRHRIRATARVVFMRLLGGWPMNEREQGRWMQLRTQGREHKKAIVTGMGFLVAILGFESYFFRELLAAELLVGLGFALLCALSLVLYATAVACTWCFDRMEAREICLCDLRRMPNALRNDFPQSVGERSALSLVRDRALARPSVGRLES
jgi:hypothetical protein